ncbi:hypothetical protein F4780DRAFT_117755 [Xylariomycetidae sp. FL0641]|nr:hypothetical protein F4780DRAFT_117755 [Xylariomycetidae sp. FL0641]
MSHYAGTASDAISRGRSTADRLPPPPIPVPGSDDEPLAYPSEKSHPHLSHHHSSVPSHTIASPGYTTYNGAPGAIRRAYGSPPSPSPPLYTPTSSRSPGPGSNSRAQLVPYTGGDERSRPRSLPPPVYEDEVTERPRSSHVRHDRRRSRQWSHDGDKFEVEEVEESTRSPLRSFVDNNFSDSPSGLGVSVLGALVGGLAGREAIGALVRGGDEEDRLIDRDQKERRKQLIGTVLGAAVGALGANAVERRFERGGGEREREGRYREQERSRDGRGWERRHRHRLSVDGAGTLETREVFARPPRRRSLSRGSRSSAVSHQIRLVDRDTRDGAGSVREERERGAGSVRGERGHRRGSVREDRERAIVDYELGGRPREREPWGEQTTRSRSRVTTNGPNGGAGIEVEIDPKAKSWKTVEDWLYDDRDVREGRHGGHDNREVYEV